MEIRKVLTLRGPNRWTLKTAFEVWIDERDVEEAALQPARWCPRLTAIEAMLRESLPEAAAVSTPVLAFDSAGPSEVAVGHANKACPMSLALIVAQITLAAQRALGMRVAFQHWSDTHEPRVSLAVVEFEDERVGRACLEFAEHFARAVIRDEAWDALSAWDHVRQNAVTWRPPASTSALLEAAAARQIPVLKTADPDVWQLGWGARQRRVFQSLTDRTSGVAERLMRDPNVVWRMLQAAGVPMFDPDETVPTAEHYVLVANQRCVSAVKRVVVNEPSVDLAAAAAETREVPTQDVATQDVATQDVATQAVATQAVVTQAVAMHGVATQDSDSVDAKSGDPGSAISGLGDASLSSVGGANDATSTGSVNALNSAAAGNHDAPVQAATRWLDVTSTIHPELAAQLVEGALMLGLDVVEFALAALDLAAPLEGVQRGVTQVSAVPELEHHCGLSAESAARAGGAIIDGLFPPGQNGRIPLIAVTGVNGKTTTTRLCAHIVGTWGKRVAYTCTDGIFLAGRRVDVEDCSGPRSARNVLMNPTLEAAVLETARGGILREGLAFDRCDVAVVTNIGEGDHLGLGGVETREELARVKRTIVDAVGPEGTAVLKADDPLTAEMAQHCRGSVVYFARDPEHPVMAAHRAKGGRVVFARDNFVVVADAQLEIPLLSFDRIPLTHNGRILFQVENVLAATAATWALGIAAEVIRNGLESFAASLEKSPGRFNLVKINGATVICDYGHNTSALKAMLESLDLFPPSRRLAVYSAAGDRRDIDMIEQGRLLGAAFDHVILYEDHYIRGRQPGEITTLFKQGLAEGGRAKEVAAVQGWALAVEDMLGRIKPGDLVLLQADTIDGAVEILKRHLSADAAAHEVNLKDALKASTPPSAV
jgi:cyanophycin synthetase